MTQKTHCPLKTGHYFRFVGLEKMKIKIININIKYKYTDLNFDFEIF